MKFHVLAALLVTLQHAFHDALEPVDFEEEFAGRHKISAACFEAGLRVICRDREMSRHLDVLTGVGFLAALQGLRRLRRQGLYWSAPPCSTWVWVSRGSSGRSLCRVRGRRYLKQIATANKIMRRAVYLAEYAVRKGAFFCFEQPSSSLASLYPPLKRFLRRNDAAEISVPLGMHGAVSEKRVTLYTNAPYLAELGVRMDPRRRQLLRKLRSSRRLALVRKYTDKSGRQRVASQLQHGCKSWSCCASIQGWCAWHCSSRQCPLPKWTGAEGVVSCDCKPTRPRCPWRWQRFFTRTCPCLIVVDISTLFFCSCKAVSGSS